MGRAINLGKGKRKKHTRRSTVGRIGAAQRPVLEKVFSLKDFKRVLRALSPQVLTEKT